MKKTFKKVLGALLALTAAAYVFAQSGKTDVWDFGGVEDKGANNHITIADLDKIENLAADGKFSVDGDINFGDLTLNVVKNDRAYNDGKKNYGTQGYSSVAFDDGYNSNGIYYCNGKGGESRRYLLLKNVKAGDVVTFYARLSNSGDETIHFASLNEKGEKNGIQDEVAPLTSTATRYSYIAVTSGAYKVYADASVGKPVFYRISRIPCIEVSGSLASLPAGNASLKFVVKDTKQELPAKISGKTYSAGLPAGHSFTAVLFGIKGYGVTSQTKQIQIAQNFTGSMKKDLAIAEQKTYLVSGKISGIDRKYRLQASPVLVFNPPAGSVYLPVEIAVTGADGNFEYKGELEPSVAYTASLSGLNDYEIKGDASFESTSALEKNLSVEAKTLYEISGNFIGETSAIPSEISFRNVEDSFIYSGKISGKTYSVNLRNGAYEVLCQNDKVSTINHVVVKNENLKKDVKLSLKESPVLKLPRQKDLYVGEKKGSYATVKEALAAAAMMNPTSEAERITIHIAPGVYRAQHIINTPYITLKNDDPSKEVKLTWYYGIGYNYYSADEKGYWNEDFAYDKYSKRGTAKWGVATYIQAGATAFRAEGITFETSFNKYVTDEEIADGVTPDGSITFVRKLNSDVRSKKATERSAAICSEATECEFYNCRFLGSQDTLYTGGTGKQYFRKCFIEGNTDFIFGDGDVVFENCEINFCGYTDLATGGYLTAARTSSKKGYLFYNCVVSADTSVKAAPGYFGRPWGPSASVAFVNTVLSSENVILPEGWTSMSGNSPEKAKFREIGTVWNKKTVETSARVKNTAIASSNDFTPSLYFAGWKPAYYTEPTSSKIALKKASFTTDDDINTPYPGHTVTVHYSLGKADSEDMSLIEWYRTKDGKKTLVKQSAGYADKSYLIQRDDSGSKISCVVTPMLRDGKSFAGVEAKLEATVKEGYSAPSKAASIKPRTAGAINVFLASDSTCKDYSSEGMWSGGQTRNEGAWGEFLQYWFNGAVAVQNYANGGRSTRNFINEGTLDKIAQNIGKGDFLFIQFGHNDCHNETGYLEDRFVPLGIPDAKGVYPVSEGKKVPTPASYASNYGDLFYSWDCGGTYKWYLKQYIEVARKAGATPVLVTPVSRKYFDSNGKIRPHHDSENTDKKNPASKYATKNNAYVEAVRQLAKEENVILIDAFEFTKALYEKSYADNKNDSEARAIMFPGDSTHNNKLGGFIIAGEFAKAIKSKIPVLAKSIIHPVKAIGENSDGSLMFTVDSNGKFSCKDSYWTSYEQKVMDAIAK